MVQMASEGILAKKPGSEPQETRKTGIPDRIRAFQKSRSLNQARLAKELGVAKRALGLWSQGRTYPPKRCWPRLVAAGICTAAELAAWRPRRPRRYSLRGVRVYDLAEYAGQS